MVYLTRLPEVHQRWDDSWLDGVFDGNGDF